jgi:hypothetical protein
MFSSGYDYRQSAERKNTFEEEKNKENFQFAFALTRFDGSVIDFAEASQYISVKVEQR